MKRHSLDQSQLYKVTSPAELAKRLGLSLEELEDLANRTDNYKRFKVGEKKRSVQEPKEHLKSLHLKIMRWLSRVDTPLYLHSAVRGRSYITNAKTHSANSNLVKVDIRSFFQSVSTHAVYLFFAKTMKCRKDAAMLMASNCSGGWRVGRDVGAVMTASAWGASHATANNILIRGSGYESTYP